MDDFYIQIISSSFFMVKITYLQLQTNETLIKTNKLINLYPINGTICQKKNIIKQILK
jgi:hypothetical protein